MPEDSLGISVVPTEQFQPAVLFQRPVQVPQDPIHTSDDGGICQALAGSTEYIKLVHIVNFKRRIHMTGAREQRVGSVVRPAYFSVA